MSGQDEREDGRDGGDYGGQRCAPSDVAVLAGDIVWAVIEPPWSASYAGRPGSGRQSSKVCSVPHAGQTAQSSGS